MKQFFTIIKNFFICLRYPWLKINSGVYPWLDNRYSAIWIDCMPDGWKLRFGWDLVHDIDAYLHVNRIKDYHIDQVKEKYAELRWYDNLGLDFYKTVLSKYIDLSRRTCAYCGKDAKYHSRGYVLPFCEECMKQSIKDGVYKTFTEITEYDSRGNF